MEQYTVIVKGDSTFIRSSIKDVIIHVTRERKLTDYDTGIIVDAVLYEERSTFVPVCTYAFEVLDSNYQPCNDLSTAAWVYEVILFFFHSILDTSYFIKRIPACSLLYTPSLVSDDIPYNYNYDLSEHHCTLETLQYLDGAIPFEAFQQLIAGSTSEPNEPTTMP